MYLIDIEQSLPPQSPNTNTLAFPFDCSVRSVSNRPNLSCQGIHYELTRVCHCEIRSVQMGMLNVEKDIYKEVFERVYERLYLRVLKDKVNEEKMNG